MSRYADISKTLPEMLNNYSELSHTAIVDTFSAMIEEGWDTDEVNEFLDAGLGISKTADAAIKHNENCGE